MKSFCLILPLVSMAIASPFTSWGNWIHNGANLINKASQDVQSATNRALTTVGTDVSKGLRDGAEGVYHVTNKIASGVDTGIDDVAVYGHKGIEDVAGGIQRGVKATTGAISHAASEVANDIKRTSQVINTATTHALNTVGTAVNNGLRDGAEGAYHFTNKVADDIDTGVNVVGHYGTEGIRNVANGINRGVQATTGAIAHAANDVASEFAPSNPNHITEVGKLAREGDNFINKAGYDVIRATNHGLNKVGTVINNGLNNADIGVTNAANKVAKYVPFTKPVTKVVIKGAGDVDYYGHEGLEKTAFGIQDGLVKVARGMDHVANKVANELAPTTTTTTTPKPKPRPVARKAKKDDKSSTSSTSS